MERMHILVQNQLFALPSFLKKEARKDLKIYYAPIYYSSIQENFFKRRFMTLKKFFPQIQIEWCTQIEESEFDAVLTSKAYYEEQLAGTKLLPLHNHLFQTLPFSMPEQFTPFQKKASTLLPERYADAVTPFDEDVLEKIERYFWQSQKPSRYFETRNQVFGQGGGTDFSPYLSSGALDVRFLYNCVKEYEEKKGRNKSTEWIVFELLWREFFYWHYQKHQTAYFAREGIKTSPAQRDFSPFPDWQTSLEEVKKQAQIKLSQKQLHPFFFQALDELEATGFLTNRARQMFASQWLNDLELDWRAGAEFFEKRLIDYDVFSNSGNWMYLAGVGVDPRGKRYFNIQKQLDTYLTSPSS
jgi:deoxyribodipyrimidine photolyase